MNTDRSKTLRMVMLAMMVAIGVVISPILRIEGMCPTAHLINIVCSVLLGPWYSLLCATLIGIIRMMFMGIPPLALTGAVFGAFLSGVFYRLHILQPVQDPVLLYQQLQLSFSSLHQLQQIFLTYLSR